MFPDSKIAQFMSLGSNKMSYLIAYGLGPFFAAQTVAEIKKAKAFFTLHFDETMNAQVKKQMDVLVNVRKGGGTGEILVLHHVWPCQSCGCCAGTDRHTGEKCHPS